MGIRASVLSVQTLPGVRRVAVLSRKKASLENKLVVLLRTVTTPQQNRERRLFTEYRVYFRPLCECVSGMAALEPVRPMGDGKSRDGTWPKNLVQVIDLGPATHPCMHKHTNQYFSHS
jgi:hypothetical protein